MIDFLFKKNVYVLKSCIGFSAQNQTRQNFWCLSQEFIERCLFI